MRRLIPILLVVGLVLAGPSAVAGGETWSYRGTIEQAKPISLHLKKTSAGLILKRVRFRYRCQWTDGSYSHGAYIWGVENIPGVGHGFAANLHPDPYTNGGISGHARRAHATGDLGIKLTVAVSTDSCDTGSISWRAPAV
jgi:hypothetical protein